MDLKSVQRLAAGGETEQVEFKETTAPRELLRAIVQGHSWQRDEQYGGVDTSQ